MLMLYSGVGITDEMLTNFIASFSEGGLLTTTLEEYGAALIIGGLVLAIGRVRRWGESHLVLPVLFWALNTSQVGVAFFERVPTHALIVSGQQLQASLALAFVVAMLAGAVYGYREPIAGRRLAALALQCGIPIATTFVDMAGLQMMLTPL